MSLMNGPERHDPRADGCIEGEKVFAAFSRKITVLVAALALTGCAGSSQADLEKARQEGAQTQAQSEAAKRQQEAQQSLATEVQRLKEEAAKTATPSATPAPPAAPQGTAPAAAGTTSCGATLSVNLNTSCAFAENVQADFYRAGGGNVTLNVYSPVTGQYYRMTCQSGIPTVCRGGTNAVVYIR